jgi:hypothetical protein
LPFPNFKFFSFSAVDWEMEDPNKIVLIRSIFCLQYSIRKGNIKIVEQV